MADDEHLTPSGSKDSNEAEAKSAADVQTESSAKADAQAESKSETETETDVGGNEVQAASHINASDSMASESIREEMSIDKDKLSSVSTNDSKLIDAQSLHERAKIGSNDEDQEHFSLNGGDKELKEEAPGSPEASAEPKSTAAPPDVDNIRHALEGFRQERRRSSMSVISDTPLVENSAPRHTSFRVRDRSLHLRDRDGRSASRNGADHRGLLGKLPSMSSAASFVMPMNMQTSFKMQHSFNMQHSFIGSKSRKRARERGSLELLATELTDGDAPTVDASMKRKASSIMMTVASSSAKLGAGVGAVAPSESDRAGASQVAAAAAIAVGANVNIGQSSAAKAGMGSALGPAASSVSMAGGDNNLLGASSRRSQNSEAAGQRTSILQGPRASFMIREDASNVKYEELLRKRSEAIQDKKASIKEASKKERAIFFEPPTTSQDNQHILRRRSENADTHKLMHGLNTADEAERKAEMNRFTALQRRAARTNTSTTPVSFYDVVETEAEPQASNTDFSERLAGRITESSWFQNFILSCIIFNTILSILYTEPDIEKNFGSLIDQADSVFLTIYLMEIWLKMIYQKGSFWLDNWNIFDFSLIFVSVLSTFVRDIGTGSSIDGRVLRFLRVLRAFRTLRILGALRKLQVVVNTFLKSLMELTNIVVMILLLIFMFAIMGLQLFQQYSPEYFGTLTQSAMTLFICITQEGWVEITDEVFESVANSDDGVDHFMSAAMHAFFIIYITIGAWTMINLISGITVTNWQLYVDEMKAMERARYHEIEMPSLRDDQVAKDTRSVSAKTVKPEVWGKQIPLASASSIGRISVQKLENYMLVLDALEKNMQEYMNLKKKLREHLDVIKSTNSILDVSLLDRESSDTRFDGDVLSIQMMQSKTPQDDDADMQRTRNAGRRSSARRSSAILPRPFMN